MKMRKYLLFMIVFMAALFGLASVSLAAEDVLITVTASPTELSEAGTVELNFSISNYTDYELHSVTIASNGGIFNLDQGELIIPANGSAYDIIIRIPVSDAQIGLPINFDVSWTQGGVPMSKSVSVTINRAADPVISLKRTSNASMARKGDVVTVEYTMTNDTKFDMSEVTLIDEELSNKPIFSNNTILAGNSITIQHTYTMGDADVVSAPVITYSVLGRTKTFSAIEPLSIQLINVKLNLDVEMANPTPTGVTFSIEVKNAGNQDVEDITILDDKKNFVNQEPFSLAAGETELITYRVVPSMDEPIRNVSFRLSGKDAMGNDYATESSGTYEVYPYVDDAQIAASLQGVILEPWSSSLGSLKVKLTVQNASTVALSNVQISEQSLGLIKVIDSLPQGESSFEQTLTIGSPRNLSFSMKGTDPAGAMRELGSFNLQVAYTEEAPAATATPIPESTGTTAFHTLSSTLTKVLIILGILMLVAFVTLVVLSIFERRYVNDLERRRAARSRMAEDELFSDTGAFTAKRTVNRAGYNRKDVPEGHPVRTNARSGQRRDRTAVLELPEETIRASEADDRDSYWSMPTESVFPLFNSLSEEDDMTAENRGSAGYERPQNSVYREAVPVEIEYDDEIPTVASHAPSMAEFTQPAQGEYHPKVIRESRGQNATAPQRNAVRRVSRKEQENE